MFLGTQFEQTRIKEPRLEKILQDFIPKEEIIEEKQVLNKNLL